MLAPLEPASKYVGRKVNWNFFSNFLSLFVSYSLLFKSGKNQCKVEYVQNVNLKSMNLMTYRAGSTFSV